ncbi:hypothetical protein LCGC14_2776590 [marine sediment metagenome]|uniref:Uncharacterized protein n=1 Tax=marine sediment metagenome TaxID=412755 RepID=A0A0F8YUI9_9ZZZZ
MDTFIKMADCPEIQGLWQPKVGDITVKLPDGFIHNVNKTDITCGYTDKWRQEIFTKYGRYVWLPTQSQLQEMVSGGDKPFDIGLLFGRAFRFLMDGNCEYITSMEQLWLAFVMKEKYNKVWDGEKRV